MNIIRDFMHIFGAFIAGLILACVFINIGLLHDCGKSGKSQLWFGGNVKCEVTK